MKSQQLDKSSGDMSEEDSMHIIIKLFRSILIS